jgi:hypothetical protein
MQAPRVRVPRRVLGRGLLGLAAVGALGPQPSLATRGWCRMDPVIRIGDDPTGIADIFVAVPLGDILAVNGETRIVVAVPPGVAAKLLVPGVWKDRRGELSGVGFGHGEFIRFVHSRRLRRRRQGIEVQVTVRVPARRAIPVRLEFAPRVLGILDPAANEGVANRPVRLRTTF